MLRSLGIVVAPRPVTNLIPQSPPGGTMAAQQQPDDVFRRVQGEYIEMPGLRLTTAQAQRLWGLDKASCDALLGALVETKFLFRTRDRAFVRTEHVRTVAS
jgi:hypothetical protein